VPEQDLIEKRVQGSLSQGDCQPEKKRKKEKRGNGGRERKEEREGRGQKGEGKENFHFTLLNSTGIFLR
jgi:hypothetical protein